MASAESILQTKRAGFVGLGRLGLCTALTFERAGWDIVGSDVFPAYVESINDKSLKSSEPGVEEALRSCRRLRVTLSLKEVVDHADVIFVLVAFRRLVSVSTRATRRHSAEFCGTSPS